MKQILFLLIMMISGFSFGQERSSIFQNLQANDVVEITYTSSGCFNTITEHMTFTKKEADLVGLFSSQDVTEKNQVLNQQTMVSLLAFEKELFGMQNRLGFCTQTNTYVVKLNGKIQTSVIDSSCSGWNGFSALRNQLFPSLQ